MQIVNVPKKELMFNNKYAYFASQSQHMKIHFGKLAKDLNSIPPSMGLIVLPSKERDKIKYWIQF